MGVRKVTRSWNGPQRGGRWWAILIACCVLALAGGVTTRTMSAGARRRQLDKMRASDGGSFVVTDEAKFDRFVAGVPRQYESIVFFTAAASEYKCLSCRMVLAEFQTLAESYAAARKKAPETLKGADIFFFVVDFSRNQGVFTQLGLQTVPRIMHFPTALAEGEEGRYAADPSQYMQMMGKVQAEDMARFVKEKTGATIAIVRPEPPVALILTGLVIVSVLALKPLISNIGGVLRTIRNKYLWLMVSLLVYTFGISGGVYDIIRNPAPFHFKPDGTVLWFHPQSNMQLVVEGFITGFMTLICGLSGVMMVQVAPKLSSPQARRIAVGVFGSGFIFLFVHVMKLYKFKNPWYRPLL